MAYTVKKMSFEEAKKQIQDYEYALIYGISEICLTKTESLLEINWDECTEARFFGETGELHFFEVDGFMRVSEVKDAGTNEDEIIKTYELVNKFKTQGKKISVKEYLDYDADGQAEVVLTRLLSVE